MSIKISFKKNKKIRAVSWQTPGNTKIKHILAFIAQNLTKFET